MLAVLGQNGGVYFLEKYYIELDLYLRSWRSSVSTQWWPFYCWEIRYSGNRCICRYRGTADLTGSTSSIFWCSLTFYKHSPCVPGPVHPWMSGAPWSFERQNSDDDWGHLCCDSQCSDIYRCIRLELQSTHSKVSCIWSFYSCSFSPLLFFIKSW